MNYINNQCEYAIYAEAVPFAESTNYLDNNLPFSVYFSYYPDTVEYNQVDSSGVGGGTSNPYIEYPFSFSQGSVQDIYYRSKILPLFPEGWKNNMPTTTTYHLLYNRELFNNTDYSADKRYGCLYVQYVGNSNYVRLDKYLNLDIAPVVPDTNDDIYFLYDLGQNIMNNSVVKRLLNLDINGVSFFNVLFGGGFVVFATWCIVKWVIPL